MCSTLEGLTHTDTKGGLVDCTPVETGRKSRGRNQEASVRGERAMLHGLQGREGTSLGKL